MLEILSATDKFKEISDKMGSKGKDVTMYREGQLQRKLCALKKKNIIPPEIYSDIYPTGSVPSRLYGLPKIHKISGTSTIPPFRPIVSSVGAYNHKLAKYLAKILQPLIPKRHAAQDTFSFVSELSNQNLESSFLVSFDVVSLFTNIPLGESINLAVDKIFESKVTKFSKKDLKQLFLIATSQTHFLFNGKYYDQIDGVCMGSPLGPVLANLFMGEKESEWLSNFNGSGPKFYKRYVDDIFCIFENESQVEPFLAFLNSRHQNIKFTVEKELGGKLPFLDVLISKREDRNFDMTTYLKPTNSGLLTNFLSFTAFPYKLGLVKTLFDRSSKINSNELLRKRDFQRIKNTLQRNNFPSLLLNKISSKVLRSQNDENSSSPRDESEPRFFKLPYLGHFSSQLSLKMKKLVERYCKDTNIKLIFTTCKIGSYFPNKDQFLQKFTSHVVYHFKCAECNICYIGETHRHYDTRVHEHLYTDKTSSVYKHLGQNPNCKNRSNKNCFSILDRADTKFKLKIKEAYYVKKQHPMLNIQVQSYKSVLACV